MALRLAIRAPASSSRHLNFPFCATNPSRLLLPRHPHAVLRRRLSVTVSSLRQEEGKVSSADSETAQWGKVSAVLFDMDGVLCNSEALSRKAAVEVFAELGYSVTPQDFEPFTGTGEANFLGGVAKARGVKDFDTASAKKRYYEIYLDKYAKPESGIGFPGANDLIMECKKNGLKVAVASSADRIKVDANLRATGLTSVFDAIVSADAFENLKPAPDIFLAASRSLNVPPSECLVIEDALAGVQAANAAKMRSIAVTTSLTEQALQEAGPSLIRKDIGNISLDDILSGGDSSSHYKKMQAPQNTISSGQIFLEMVDDRKDGQSKQDKQFGGLQGSRRDILRYASLAAAVSCFVFAATNWKAMQYASFTGVLNMLFGGNQPMLDQKEGGSRASRIKQFVKYISDVESRGNASMVPEFPSKLDWLNTAPLQWRRDLKGKVVLLDFWTYCCINCMHVLPDLEFLEKKFKDKPFAVVGVHSAKFDNEKDLEAIRNAVLRYNISHPVVNDGDMYLWRSLGISSWPTFVIVSPNGKLLAQIAGEGHRQDLDDLVEAALLFYGDKKLLENSRLPLALEKDNDQRLLTSPLKFPGKLTVDALNNRLFISDSNHNRIVVIDLEGNFIVQVGSTGEDGLRDGTFDNATFNRPQGLTYNPKKNVLYVADTENHALRQIDFVNETVVTLAGNGIKGSDYRGGGKGTAQVLNSPWDLCFDPSSEMVYIAMAGQHQIWEHNTLTGVTKAFSGDGFERNLNGSSSTSTSFAQPSGISLFPGSQEAYIADSESSSIRALDLETGGSRLLAGGDPFLAENLFKYGDHDGIGADVLFQHPLGVLCGKDRQIYIADSYNHKIKKLDPVSKRVVTIAGTGTAGFKDGSAMEAQLSEPSGVVEDGNGKLFIADTNNNIIRYLDMKEKAAVLHTLELKGVRPPSLKSKSLKRLNRRPSADTEIIKIEGSSSMEGDLYVKISVPDGYRFSKEAQSKFYVDTDPDNAVIIEPSNGILNPEGSASLHFKRSNSSPSLGRINCKVYYCKEDEVCLYQSLAFEIPFKEEPSVSATEITIPYTVKPKVSTGFEQLAVTY